MLTPAEIATIEREIAVQPVRQAASIEALRTVQRTRGYVSDETLAEVADFLGMPCADLEAVATFYNLIFRRPVGRHVIFLCDSVSCWLTGENPLLESLALRLGILLGQTTRDRRFTLLPIQCLGACDGAPAMMVDEELHTNVTPESLNAILARYP
jgi:NADH-quinone oxidoreductase subunit E